MIKMTRLMALASLSILACSTPSHTESVGGSGFKLRTFKTDKLPNGLEIVFLEDHSLPYVSAGLMLKTGSAQDQKGRAGTMNLVAETLSKGTSKRTAVQIVSTLGNLGARFSNNVDHDYSWFVITGLSFHQTVLSDLFQEVIFHPAFKSEELDRQRNLVEASLTKLTETPSALAGELFNRFLFENHPYGVSPLGTIPEVKKIKRSDLETAYKKFFIPSNAVLVLAGDWSPESYKTLLAKFEKWKSSNSISQELAQPTEVTETEVKVVVKEDLTQSQIHIGHLGIKRSDPDFLPLRLANLILGGDMSARLMDRVRVQLGLTYGIYSSFDALLVPGALSISTFTKNETVGRVVDETQQILAKFVKDGVSVAEVEAAKNYLLGMFPRAIETPEKLGNQLSMLRLYGVGDDYLKNFVRNVRLISSAQVNDVIKRRFNPDKLKILLLTPKSTLKTQVSRFSKVQLVELKDALVP